MNWCQLWFPRLVPVPEDAVPASPDTSSREFLVASSFRYSSSELILSEAGEASNPASSTTQSRWSLPPVFSIRHCPHRGCSCLYFQTPVLRRMLYRKTSGSATIARLSSCYACRPVSTSLYAPAVFLHGFAHWTN